MLTYRIADLIVLMDASGRTKRQAEKYRVDGGEPQLLVEPKTETIHASNPEMSYDDCEYMATGASFYKKLLCHDGMMLHASCVVVDGKAYLFSAPSGTGKSTHVGLWMKLFGEKAFILNDDKPALRIIDGTVYVYGTPWSGKFDCSVNARAELGGIAILKRGADNSIRHMEPEEAFYALMDQTLRRLPVEFQMFGLDIIEKIIATGKIYELTCNMDSSAAILSYEKMSGKRYNYED